MAMEMLPHYGKFNIRCRKRLVDEGVFRLIISKVSAALVSLLIITLVIFIYRPGTRVGFDDPTNNLRRMSAESGLDQSLIGRRLLGLPVHEQEKKEALKKLEDVLLEPPRAASERSRTYQRRTKYLSDLMGEESLKRYPRRVFIAVGPPGNDGAGWFMRTYPTRNLDFEKYEIETLEDASEEGMQRMGVSEWVRERVKEEEFVVMKAEAEAVEEIVKSKAIKLVDELFLECKTKKKVDDNKKRKAYWECLALYGKLKDEGVAVHQWWG